MNPINLQDAKNLVNEYYLTKFYDDYNNKINIASSLIEKYNGKSQYCCVLDFDETILDKSCIGRCYDYGYTDAVLKDGWTNISIPVFKSMCDFMLKCISYKIGVYIITGRTEIYREATVAQMRANKVDESTHYTKLIMKPNNCTDSTVIFKSRERQNLEKDGLVILLNIGDHEDDLVNQNGQYHGLYPILLPNYMY